MTGGTGLSDDALARVEIEEASAGDIEEIVEVQRLAFREEMKLYGFFDIPPLTETVEEVLEALHEQVVLKAVCDGAIVGAVRATVREGSCLVGRLVVRPELWNRGIGRALMDAVEERYGDSCRLELFTGSRSIRNITLYEKLGYVAFRTEDVGDSIQLIYMEKARGAGRA